MSKKIPASSVPSGLPFPPVIVGPEGGGSYGSSTLTYDSTYDFATDVQLAIAPRADMRGPWYVTNMGPNTIYLGPSGVTSGNGTAVSSGSKSASVSADNASATFVICAPGNKSTIHITNS
jgi:hypothetical protein